MYNAIWFTLSLHFGVHYLCILVNNLVEQFFLPIAISLFFLYHRDNVQCHSLLKGYAIQANCIRTKQFPQVQNRSSVNKFSHSP
uniref:Uncharacterized protein n=1 Tax=Arundo donax TaxID=35708 RepID=A0A0A9DNS8_ARUDO